MRATGSNPRKDAQPVIVAGCDDVGSAIAHTLHAAGSAVILVDDVDPPWARRGMSYTDAWYVGGATLDGVDACFCGSVRSLPAILARGDMIAATTWSVHGVAAALKPLAMVETRPGCATAVARCRPDFLEGVVTIGVRTTRIAGWGADVIIAGARHPDRSTPRALPVDVSLTKRLRIDAPHPGRFRTRHEIAERVEIGDVLGELGTFAAIAPVAGVLTGLAPRGARVAAGHTLAEIDPCGNPAGCFGISPESRAMAQRVGAVVRAAARACA